MTTTNKTLTATYSLITSETEFIAQNRHHTKQEWLRASSTPSESLLGLSIEPEKGLDSDKGSGNLYGRGAGLVVVIT